MDWELLARYVPEIILVVIFMIYQERADARHKQAEKEIEQKRIASAERNHAEWRDFIREQDTAKNAAIGRIAEEVKEVAKVVVAGNAVLIAHDTKATDAIGDVRRIRERLAQARIGDVDDSPLPPGKKP